MVLRNSWPPSEDGGLKSFTATRIVTTDRIEVKDALEKYG
jgi:hypothetical protein